MNSYQSKNDEISNIILEQWYILGENELFAYYKLNDDYGYRFMSNKKIEHNNIQYTTLNGIKCHLVKTDKKNLILYDENMDKFFKDDKRKPIILKKIDDLYNKKHQNINSV